MFGPLRGPWDVNWRRWWGDEPPYDAPVFVLTHHPQDPIAIEGGTTFHFITEGFDVAFERAKAAAGDLGVDVAGGASIVRQAFAAGVIRELMLHVAPVLLGAGERLFDGVQDPAGIDARYLNCDVAPEALGDAVRDRRGSGADGRGVDHGGEPRAYSQSR
jgi:dihydrofolate reductase